MSYWAHYFIFDIQIIERLSNVNSQTIYQHPSFCQLHIIILKKRRGLILLREDQ